MNAIDSNVLIYSLDSADVHRGPVAIRLLASLRPSDTVMLWQVACEVGSVIVRHVRSGQSPPEALDVIPIVLPTVAVPDTALRISREHQVSSWDSMLVAACCEARVARLYTEDVQSRRTIEGVEIVNPFAAG